MRQANQAEDLSGDLAGVVAQLDLTTLVGKVQSTDWSAATDQGMEMQVGTVTVEVVEVLHGGAKLLTGATVEVPAKRAASANVRARNRVNYWNALRLNPSDLLLLACRPAEEPRVCNAAAGRHITSPAADDVQAMRKAYEIEEFTGDGAQRRKLLAAALQSSLDLLNRYALDFLDRHVSTERDSAVQLLRDAINSPTATSGRRLNFALAMTGQGYLVRDRKADAANQIIIGALATALVNESDSDTRATLARILASAVLMEFSPDATEAAKIRSALTHSPQGPPAQRVISVLSEIIGQSTGDQREMLSRLLKTWQATGS